MRRHNPPYASSVVFELLEVSGTGGDDDFGVRIYYNQGVGSLWDSTNILELPGCTDPCPLAQFQRWCGLHSRGAHPSSLTRRTPCADASASPPALYPLTSRRSVSCQRSMPSCSRAARSLSLRLLRFSSWCCVSLSHSLFGTPRGCGHIDVRRCPVHLSRVLSVCHQELAQEGAFGVSGCAPQAA